jgi:Uma2 family endonuclease
MRRRPPMELRDDNPSEDHVVQLSNATWSDYERMLELRGDRSAPRITFLEGELEIMSPSRDHERIKSLLGCLVEAYCLHADVTCMPYGSWTLKDRRRRRGAEADECYVFGEEAADRPHLAIEVVWTWAGLDKLEVYRELGVQEVWIWRKGKLQVHALRGARRTRARSSKQRTSTPRYEAIDRSELLPGLDLDLLVKFLDRPSFNAAVRDFRRALSS